jgi:hypothetical protein
VSFRDDNPVGLDLYYDPVVDEHVGHGPMGIIAPAWYFAPQRPEVALAGWRVAAAANGISGDGPIVGLDEPPKATMLLQFAGEFADVETKERIWAAAEDHIQPTWDRKAGEFTLGFGLDEAHPRGQMNARAMAGWVCTAGAWTRIFNEPNLAKFDEPTVQGVDFPRIALSEARWDGAALHLAAHPQNKVIAGSTTNLQISNVESTQRWIMTDANGDTVELSAHGDHVNVDLVADNRPVVIRRK